MTTPLVLTAIGSERPGLVSALAQVVEMYDGNWLTSELTRLAGSFAGIVLVEVPEERVDAFRDALARLRESDGLDVRVTPAEPVGPAAPTRELSLHLIGHDRPGIVREITHALAERGVTIAELSSSVVDAAQAGGTLFEADFTVLVPGAVADEEVREALESITAELMVDLDFGP